MTIRAEDQAALDKIQGVIDELPTKLAGASQATIDAAVKPVQDALDQEKADHADTTAALEAKADALVTAAA